MGYFLYIFLVQTVIFKNTTFLSKYNSSNLFLIFGTKINYFYSNNIFNYADNLVPNICC